MTDPAPSASRDDFESMYEKYMLHHPADIRARLRQLIDKRCTVMVRAPGQEDATTAALALGERSIWFDVPRDADLTPRLQTAEKLRFESAIERIGVRFTTGPARLGTYEGLPALEVDLPEKLIHLQRRDYVRREPLSSLGCTLSVPASAGGDHKITARIADIGGGGLAVLTSDDAALQPAVGDELEHVVLELPEDGPLTVRLRVQHVAKFEQNGRTVMRAGCQFVQLSAQDQARLVRYVMHLDRLHSIRRRELGS
ncbi:flagellar brake protein [Lysobacter korlensis]|uniref:Flagellar brake protein YcgR n=2 Tax=Lysobacter korlensis TaxID=553636 RepID=A0ABV6RJC1_9GAMM